MHDVYTLILEGDETVLLKNNKPALCPFQNKLVIPGSLHGQLQVQEFGCSSRCALFVNDKTNKRLCLKCSDLVIETIETKEIIPQPFSNIKALA